MQTGKLKLDITFKTLSDKKCLANSSPSIYNNQFRAVTLYGIQESGNFRFSTNYFSHELFYNQPKVLYLYHFWLDIPIFVTTQVRVSSSNFYFPTSITIFHFLLSCNLKFENSNGK
ncbi:MAG: hypothetical protein A3H98_09880 [Bacteroidetes bacterium RIFCSPLOWO2_02_FULL_36_8]|nr:MAG: hypothetical protein A3H98_09880 [Bacteroidetes bacterium RIFCSPLOWO2_02_FULL_36_8]